MDSFRYDCGQTQFEYLKDYWDNYSVISDDLFKAFSGNEIAGKYSQYGKDIGSYLQLLTHMMHIVSAEEKEHLFQEAISYKDRMLGSFVGEGDLSRAHQNLADLYAEHGDYEEAVQELLLAVDKNQENAELSTAEKCDIILNATGTFGEQDDYRKKFIFSHYALIMNRALISESELSPENSGLIMATALKSRRDFNIASYADYYRDESYPIPVILWHLASSFARSGLIPEKKRDALISMFNRGINLMRDRQVTFSAIAIAMQAEKIGLALQGLLPIPEKMLAREKENLLAAYSRFKEGDHADPFEECFETGNADYKAIYGRIAY